MQIFRCLKRDQEFFKSTSVSSFEKGRLKFVEGAMNIFDNLMDLWTPLHTAVSTPDDDSEAVEVILNGGADVNAQDSWGITPLNLAAMYHNRNVIEVLLKYGADVNIPDWKGNTPLHSTVFSCTSRRDSHEYENHLLIVKSLLQNGAHVNSLTHDQETPLMLAVHGSHLGIIKELLQWGADVHIRNNEYETCLHIASFHPKYHIPKELLKHGACTECFDKDGKTVLDSIFQYCGFQEPEQAKTFIKTATLVNMGRWTELSLNEENDRLREFMQECVEEVVGMKSIQLSKNFSLHDFALRSDCDGNYKSAIEKSIFHRVLETLIIFPIYRDIIEDHFHRSDLLDKLLGMKIYAICETTEVYLHSDIIDLICSFLPDEDLLNFFKTSTESTSCNRE